MPLNPQQIVAQKFRIVRRGYDQEQVDQFLNEVADQYRKALRSRGGVPPTDPSDPYGALGEEVGQVLRATQEASDAARQRIEQEVADLRRRAEQEAQEIRAQAESTAGSAVAAARETAERVEREAEERAMEVTEAAERRARELREETDRQCRELLDHALRKHERLEEHERELNVRIQAVENALSLLRAEMDQKTPNLEERF